MADPTDITIRRAEPDDYPAYQQIFAGPKVIWGTLQLPYPTAERWRKVLAEPAEGSFDLVACVDGEVVGQLYLGANPNRPRRRHAGQQYKAYYDNLVIKAGPP